MSEQKYTTKELRARKGWTQAETAQKLGFQYKHIMLGKKIFQE